MGGRIEDEGGAVRTAVVPVRVVPENEAVAAEEEEEKLAEDAAEEAEWPSCRCCCHCNRSIQRRRSNEIGVPAAAVDGGGVAVDVVIDAERTDGAMVESVVEAVRDEEIDVRNDCDNVDHDERCA